MADFEVKDVVVGALDSTGAKIESVHAKVSGRFAVYCTNERVMIQFADDDASGVNQRDAIRPLAPLRAEIENLIAYLRMNPSPHNSMLLASGMSKLAVGLAEGIKGNIDGAMTMLTNVRNELADARSAKMRTVHLGFAALATLGLICLATLLSSDIFTREHGGLSTSVSPIYWLAGSVGGIGALFSIAVEFRERTAWTVTPHLENFGNAVLRIFVGAASGTILIAMVKGRLIDVTIGGQALSTTLTTDNPHGLVVMAFAAGFTQRLVPLLKKVGDFGTGDKPSSTAASGSNEVKVTGESPAPGTNQPGKPQPPTPQPEVMPTASVPHSDESAELEPVDNEPADVAHAGEDHPEPDEDEKGD